MKVVIEIEECESCPFFLNNEKKCSIEDKDVPSRYDIPDWCPMPSPSEYAESNFDIDNEP